MPSEWRIGKSLIHPRFSYFIDDEVEIIYQLTRELEQELYVSAEDRMMATRFPIRCSKCGEVYVSRDDLSSKTETETSCEKVLQVQVTSRSTHQHVAEVAGFMTFVPLSARPLVLKLSLRLIRKMKQFRLIDQRIPAKYQSKLILSTRYCPLPCGEKMTILLIDERRAGPKADQRRELFQQAQRKLLEHCELPFTYSREVIKAMVEERRDMEPRSWFQKAG